MLQYQRAPETSSSALPLSSHTVEPSPRTIMIPFSRKAPTLVIGFQNARSAMWAMLQRMLTRTPWWLDEAPADPPAPPLAGDAEADVCVVGGGYTGLWTALALRRREPSLRVVVLEAAHVGHGPSGRNGGF